MGDDPLPAALSKGRFDDPVSLLRSGAIPRASRGFAVAITTVGARTLSHRADLHAGRKMTLASAGALRRSQFIDVRKMALPRGDDQP